LEQLVGAELCRTTLGMFQWNYSPLDLYCDICNNCAIMQKVTIAAFEARRKFGQILDTVGFRGDTVVVEKNGERLAAIVPIQFLDKWEEQRRAFFDQMREISERASVSAEEAEELATEAVQAVRAERQGGQLA
jgi:prevent-host-death family protein